MTRIRSLPVDLVLNGALGLALLLAMACAWGLGPVPLSFSEWSQAVLHPLTGAPAARETLVIVWDIRLPRVLAGAMVGAGLGLAGAGLQGLLRNPLADPGVLGASGLAALAAVLALASGAAAISALVLPLAALAGALLATILLVAIASTGVSTTGLVLAGVGLSSLSGSLIALVMNLVPNPFSLADLVNWMLGSLAAKSLDQLALAAPFFALGASAVLASGAGLSLLTLGDHAAAASGLSLARVRLLVIAGAGLLVGACVSLAGAIGFVGLVAPHIVRPLVKYVPARVLVPAGLLGALLVVLADLLVRVLPGAVELKLGVVLGLIGAPAFVWIALTAGARDA